MNRITAEILNCGRCENSSPFFFEIKQQRIMLITASSTLQTNYLPLTYVRFMRNLLYYLLGLEGVSEAGLQHFIDDEGIYWTSYNKCYDRAFLSDIGDGYKMDKFSRYTCGDSFLQKEYNELRPQYVIVMGKATCEAVRLLINKSKLKMTCEADYCDYFYQEPDTELIERIRTRVADILEIPRSPEKFSRVDTKTSATNSKVHLNFQRNVYHSIASIFDGEFDEEYFENTVEQYWIQNVVTPLKLRYYKFLEIWSSLENSVNASFMNIYDASEGLKKGYYIDFTAGAHRKGWFLSNWQTILELKGKVNMKTRGEVLYEKADILRKLRNSIVHNNGRLTIADAKEERLNDDTLIENGFSEIWLFPNLIFLTESGVQQIYDFYRAMTDFLISLE